ncbi:amidase family protein [Pseudonocardia sp. KRD291]|uniref:amidase family protein n=1 Tax=Pseudonocardia sp. KRD291 TaxID=2792007 RepID=UPI001C4A755C|nr:amidase family protein [Pseudonocardia sp. KRD291]MBW0104967.1 amidase [Pseudonocardia sp. KRD291]
MIVVTDDVATWTATRLARAVRDRETGSRELLEVYLGRVASSELDAVVTVDAERARAEAAACADETARGHSRGPLHGLPITVKDAIEVAGMRCTGGATELSEHVPDADAPAVARLREAGAVVFGRTNVPRFSVELQTTNELFGTTSNPWDLARTPGGSSGGAAAAVAAGLTAFELGTDIGGSIRVPSHFCGVFGLKPSFGLVPTSGYLDQVGGGAVEADINVFGPLARGADDLDLLLRVLAAPSPRRSPAWRVELPEPRVTGLRDLRVALWSEHPALPVDPAYAAVLRGVADRLAGAGARVAEAQPPVDPAEQLGLYQQLLAAAVSPSLPDELAVPMAGGHREWLRAQAARAAMTGAWARWFADVDVLLCPVTFTTAFAHATQGRFGTRMIPIEGGELSDARLVDWPGMIGLLELPSAVAPVGTTAAGLPAGVQVVAPYLQDRRAVAVAGLVADLCGGYRRPPHH